jgi:coproporphyrinogen III oxidase-like Fe-S oxidoreductase
MAQSALSWLTRLCTLYAKHSSEVKECIAEVHPSGVMVTIEVEDGAIQVLVRRKTEGKAYTKTASFSVSLRGAIEGEMEQGRPEQVALQFIAVLDRADKGGIELPVPGSGPSGASKQPPIDEARAAAAREAYADELKWASFVGYKAVVTEDLYPHIPLGEPIPQQEILDGWIRTLERKKEGTAPDKLGLYVHMPFCTVACSFCYCGKTDRFNRAMMEGYLSRLHQEIEFFAPAFKGSTFTSVYFGGGTPSLMTAPAMKKLFGALYSAFDVPRGTQVIFEGNPDSLSDSKIQVLANEGRVTRLTIGVQTLDDKVQALVRRFNKPEHVAEAIASAREHGIEHVNCDIMAGMPLQTQESFQRDVEFLYSLGPDSLHLNGYRPLPRTRLASAEPMTEEEKELRNQMLIWGNAFLAERGHVDKSGQGRRRTQNAANIQEYDLRRQNSSLLGLGYPSRAHSFGGHYYSPDTSIGFDEGLARESATGRVWRGVAVDDREEQHKYLVTNFRTGFSRAEFESIFGVDVCTVAPEAFEKLEALGVISVDDEHVRTYVNSPMEDFTYRTFLYSPKHMARAREVWGSDFDPEIDYTEQLLELTESVG